MLLPIASVSPYRWLLMLTYPLSFFATEPLSQLKSVTWKRWKFTLQKIAVLYIICSTALISIGFLLFPPEQPFTYFNPSQVNNFSYQIPSSMLVIQFRFKIALIQISPPMVQHNASNRRFYLSHSLLRWQY
jgi:hypothetical protein